MLKGAVEHELRESWVLARLAACVARGVGLEGCGHDGTVPS